MPSCIVAVQSLCARTIAMQKAVNKTTAILLLPSSIQHVPFT